MQPASSELCACPSSFRSPCARFHFLGRFHQPFGGPGRPLPGFAILLDVIRRLNLAAHGDVAVLGSHDVAWHICEEAVDLRARAIIFSAAPRGVPLSRSIPYDSDQWEKALINCQVTPAATLTPVARCDRSPDHRHERRVRRSPPPPPQIPAPSQPAPKAAMH